MTNDEIDAVILALKKIARELGENENIYMSILRDKNIRILDEDIGLRPRYSEINLIEKFTRERYEQFLNPFDFFPNYLEGPIRIKSKEIERINGEKFLKYKISILRDQMDQEIYNDLKYECDIRDSDLSEEKWAKIRGIKLWNKCEQKVTKEVIASFVVNSLELEV